MNHFPTGSEYNKSSASSFHEVKAHFARTITSFDIAYRDKKAGYTKECLRWKTEAIFNPKPLKGKGRIVIVKLCYRGKINYWLPGSGTPRSNVETAIFSTLLTGTIPRDRLFKS